ncbi:hypothetical protein GCM10010339_52160 [Streptomyces alanosinicus]|uniref:Uncharacterized protein n=1 Tax=Streptomyces alanosinicus TaxID=68171 RepID=A0A919D3I7_9ACTN|nr:hypothetical protein GCM10010339_52160 [Streptomyces alanosinicus]
MAVRRLVRRVQSAPDRAFDADVPALLDAAGGHAVVPGATELPSRTMELLREPTGPAVRPAGPHRLDDVLLEYHLSRPSAGSERIAALLDPLAAGPNSSRPCAPICSSVRTAAPRPAVSVCTPTPSTTGSPASRS